MTSAALIVVVVAGSFAFADIVLIKALGLGVAIAVALDATVVRALLVPATMRLLGHWNWWMPAWLQPVRRPTACRPPRRRPRRASGAPDETPSWPSLVARGRGRRRVHRCGRPDPGQPERAPPVPARRRPTAPAAVADPQPVVFPRDDGPHDRLTEWWYFTGHLAGAAGDGVERRFGFEYVIFRAERGDFPPAWASHLAITDETGDAFHYAQRQEVGPQVDRSPRGVDRRAGRLRPRHQRPGPDRPDDHRPRAVDDGRRPGLAGPRRRGPTRPRPRRPGSSVLGLDLAGSPSKSPALHDEDGWIDFGPAGGSYYYSRTDDRRRGHGRRRAGRDPGRGHRLVRPPVGRLHQRRRRRLGLVRGQPRGRHGPDPVPRPRRRRQRTRSCTARSSTPLGGTRHLPADAFTVEVTDRWTSPTTGADYPAGWRIDIPGQDLVIDLRPTVADQELDTRATTGVIYWEGSQVVEATRDGVPLGGEAYVELTGYAPSTRAPR